MLWRQPRWQSSFLVQNIKCPHSGWAGIRDQNWNVTGLSERGNRIQNFWPYYVMLGGCIFNQCHAMCNIRSGSLQWTSLSILECLQHMGTIRLCRFDNKVPWGVAFKCSLHLPRDRWTSLKCPITSALPSRSLQMCQSRFLQKQSTFREKLCH